MHLIATFADWEGMSLPVFYFTLLQLTGVAGNGVTELPLFALAAVMVFMGALV